MGGQPGPWDLYCWLRCRVAELSGACWLHGLTRHADGGPAGTDPLRRCAQLGHGLMQAAAMSRLVLEFRQKLCKAVGDLLEC